MVVIFSLFDMMRIKSKGKVKARHFALALLYCFHVEPSFTSRAERTSQAWVLSYIACFFKQSSKMELDLIKFLDTKIIPNNEKITIEVHNKNISLYIGHQKFQ